MTAGGRDAISAGDQAVLDAFPHAPVDLDDIRFYRGILAHQFLAGKCGHCGNWQFPVLPICPSCWSTDLHLAPVGGNGTIYMLIRRRVPGRYRSADGGDLFAPGGTTPVGSVELDEQPDLRVTSIILPGRGGGPRIGDRVTMCWIERDDAPFPAFEVADA